MRDQAFNILQELIISGKLEPETKLKDQELSEMLGISRTPIREALLRLENMGLVITKANSSTTVAPIDLKEASNIYSIVETLESLAIEQGFPNVRDKDIKELELLNARFQSKLEENDSASAFQLDNDFHKYLVLLSKNTELASILDNLKVKVQRMEIYYFGQNNHSHESVKEHKQIIGSLRKRDKESLLKAVKINWQKSLQRIQQKIGTIE
ncbi:MULTISPECIES: GntR family transcriptional regulator [unclassified Sporosarcina]|uniref:GntR family transcriptional regulator n=1 Tax=unclassified Sporosarcina TaxID=2647733 RepID=UPI0009BFA220|nr:MULTISPECIES: GntR family transcriptional regulator [unclassified Sporosarcina]ARD49614.1 hypothetical protein SporoP33_03365 [Sporosarcina sp. P33]PID17283.1 GntR family transcriptional regulator [Sporosarcina sp. P35]